MKPSYSLLLLAAAAIFLASTGFQCGSAEITSAKLYMQQKQWDKAEQSLVKELAKNDKNEEAWFLLGQARLEQRNYVGMNEAYTRALALGNIHEKEINQNRLAIWANLYNEGVGMYNKGKDDPAEYDKALQNFNTAIDMVPDSSGTYYVAALAYYAKKDLVNTATMLERTLEKNAQAADAAKFLGQIEYQKASEAYARGDSATATSSPSSDSSTSSAVRTASLSSITSIVRPRIRAASGTVMSVLPRAAPCGTYPILPLRLCAWPPQARRATHAALAPAPRQARRPTVRRPPPADNRA